MIHDVIQKSGWYSEIELKDLGFKKIGKNIKISTDVRIFHPEKFECGDNVRIDAFAFLTGEIKLGSFIHISPFCILQGTGGGIIMENFSAFSGGVKAYTSNADYSKGESLTNPTIPNKFKNSDNDQIILHEHCLVGANSVILPNSKLNEGSIFGALSLIKGEYEKWTLYGGIPAKKIKTRPQKKIQEDGKKLLKEHNLI